MITKIFVYGTLRKGEGLNEYMGNFKYLGVTKIDGFEIYSNGYFPMIIRGNGEVVGEVYEIENGQNDISMLDRIECAYIRTKVNVVLNGEDVEVETYIYKDNIQETDVKINSGDWLVR